MAEEEVQYASVVFKGNQRKPQAKREPETIYAEVKVQNEAAVASAGPLAEKEAEKRSHDFQKLAYCFGTICFILLLGIIGICVYLTKIHNDERHFKSTQMALLFEKSNHPKINTEITSLNAENQKLNTENKQLEAEKKNLTEELKNKEDAQIKFNASRAQWSIDAYCPKTNNFRTCQQCEKDWLNNQDSCYAVNNAAPDKRRSWEEARKICRGKGSDLVVVDDEKEKTFVNDKSWGSSGTTGFWIGLKAENGTWKWIDGSYLANNSWMTEQLQDGQCVISVQSQGWKSVSCNENQQWICEKAALSV
ncbi:unnamed protein product [Menidia menidia]|uniref:(Atlantic silverside) hypothetical protein n=1 Tax=Menidia menidia TaxID=238744 RepID=A0A8S4BQE2_9TELE|nr:unnamed protein product [Menidia menidia]